MTPPNIWPRYKNLIDAGQTVTIQMEHADGSVNGVVLDKRYQGNVRDLTPDQRRTILFRDFDTMSSRSLLFKLNGGIGDILIAFEAILTLKTFLKEHSDQRFEFTSAYGFMTTSLTHQPIFSDSYLLCMALGQYWPSTPALHMWPATSRSLV